MKISSTSFNHFAFWFVTVLATPLFIAVNNPDDVAMPVGTLALLLVAICVSLTLLSSGLSSMAGASLAQRIGLLLLGFALVLAVQCNIVHDLFFYGNFNGEAVNFRNNGESFMYEWYGFLAGLVLVTLVLQWFRPKGRWLAALPVLSSSLLLIPALLASFGEGPPAGADEEIDPSVFEFSRNGNLIHLIPDGFQSDVVQQVLEENPELAAAFEGFTLFANHLGMFQGTAPSVPTILTGTPFDLGEGHQFQRVMDRVRVDGYPNTLKEAGHRLDYALISGAYCAPGADSCVARPFNDMKARGYQRHKNQNRTYALRILADLTLFRLLPMVVKEKIYDDGHWYFSDTTMDGSSPWPDPVIREWTEKMQVNDGPPTFKFYHYIGTHIPPHWDSTCTYQRDLERIRENYLGQARCVLEGIAGLITRLKELGIYDQTAFLISGDHGHGTAPADELRDTPQSALPPALMGSARPAFLIKEKNNREPLFYSRIPTSLVDIAPTALALAGVEEENPRTSVFDLDENSDRPRYFLPYSIRDLFSGDPVPHVIYRVGNDVRDSRGWQVDEIKPYRTAPSLYDPVNYRSGQHFVHGLRFSTNEPDKEASWVNGRQLAFLLSQPPRSDGPFELRFGLHVPKWLGEQSMTVSVNGQLHVENLPIEMGKGFWTKVVVDMEGLDLLEQDNFVSVQFANSHLPPGITHWEAAALLRSIRLAKRRVSDTSTTGASLP